ncbi:MAG: NAD-binding protein [Rhodanobacter sp.]
MHPCFPESAIALLKLNAEQLRTLWHATGKALRLDVWFPQIPLAALMWLGGIWLLEADVGRNWQHYFSQILHGSLSMPPQMLPPILIGSGMLTIALGLLWRSRIAWVMAMLLVLTAAISTRFGVHAHGSALLIYFLVVLGALLFCYRQFDRSSVAASTLFALTSVAMLLMYATFGSYYLGAQYRPAITDLITALYYSMVTMSTVGYGDIVPLTSEAKLFTVSIIVLGVAVFATSLTAVIAPMISHSLQRIVSRKGRHMKREKHFVVIGNTSLATNTWRELTRRGRPVTRLLRRQPDDIDLEGVDVVIGDPGNVDVLRQAGVDQAQAVMAMMDDDSENAFAILAARELGGGARTVAALNDGRHRNRIKLAQPDVVIAPQLLGGELLAMLLTGEEVTSEFVMKSVFQDLSASTGTPDGGGPATA